MQDDISGVNATVYVPVAEKINQKPEKQDVKSAELTKNSITKRPSNQNQIESILQDLQNTLQQQQVDTDFGAFGVIARMNTNFHLLKQHYSAKRRKSANDKVRQALKQIAVDAVVAQTLL